MTMLSKNFSLREFCQSQTATRMGREIVPDQNAVDNLTELCEAVLQPVRDYLTNQIDPGIRMHITSGLRPEWLNKKIGGSKTSAHVFGGASDWGISGAPDGFELYDVCQGIIRDTDIEFDQLIYEGGRWIHSGIRDIYDVQKSNRNEVLTATFTKNQFGRRVTRYQRGLVRVA